MDLKANIQLFSFFDWSDRDGDDALKKSWLHDNSSPIERWKDRLGYCSLCERTTKFTLGPGAIATEVDAREQIICSECRLNSRVRAAFGLATSELDGRLNPTVYITEQASLPFGWAQRNLPATVIGSEFENDKSVLRRLTDYLDSIGGKGQVEFQDVTQLSYEDDLLDLVISMDVLEHVPDYAKAIAEFHRVLKPGGCLIATFPFLDKPETLVRAKWSNQKVEHVVEPEYHGDPLGSGILCWYHFGWDILGVCSTAGFSDAKMVMPWSPQAELRYGLWTLVARK